MSTFPSEDPYEVLGVPRNASDAELKRAYKEKALLHHPDKNHDDPNATPTFQKIAQAYALLSDKQKRARHDAGQSTFTSQADFAAWLQTQVAKAQHEVKKGKRQDGFELFIAVMKEVLEDARATLHAYSVEFEARGAFAEASKQFMSGERQWYVPHQNHCRASKQPKPLRMPLCVAVPPNAS